MNERAFRYQRTAATEAHWLLARLTELYAEREGKPADAFITEHIAPMRAAGATGDHLVEQTVALLEGPEAGRPVGVFNQVLIATAFAIQSQEAHAAGAHDLAWALLAEGMQFYGAAQFELVTPLEQPLSAGRAELRRGEMYRMREQGKSYSAIGAAFGVSRQRAEQIINSPGNNP